MKPRSTVLFRRIVFFVAALLTGVALLFGALTYVVATAYYQFSTQLLNKDVAAHIAKFTAPFGAAGLNKKKADSVFHDAMVLSPNSEVYFLDTAGKVIAYYESSKQPHVQQQRLSLTKIKEHIAAGGKDFIKGPDPRDPENSKIFSAAEVVEAGQQRGYIYVILASSKSRMVASLLLGNHVFVLALGAFGCVLVLSLLLTFGYMRRMQQRFNHVVAVLQQFQEGDFEARFKSKKGDELGAVKNAFNAIADILVYNINRLAKSEADRKLFITGITHDLRNPLAVAGGYAETLLLKKAEGSLLPTQEEEYASLILQKLRQVTHLVNQLHELSVVESPTFRPQREPFMFSELLQEIVETFRATARDKKIVIDCNSYEIDTYVEADVSMMERVIQNLIANAVAYSPAESRIIVTLSREAEKLLFSVENAGTPLPDDFINWLCSNTATVPQERFPEKPAIGLTIVKRILRLHQYPFRVSQQEGAILWEVEMDISPV